MTNGLVRHIIVEESTSIQWVKDEWVHFQKAALPFLSSPEQSSGRAIALFY